MTSPDLYRPQPRNDVLRWPIIGAVLRWRHGRLIGQFMLLAVALLIIYDGFTGPQFAPENIASVSVWLHYRGFVMLALLFFGNLFCMSCPFTLPRSLARKWSGRGRRWPRALRNKWLALAVFAFFFFAYEWLDLWASPWLTAWLVVAYFALAFALEFAFAESPFCKYVCPLGTFNMVGSTISPTQITVASPDVCRTCVGKECINGATDANGRDHGRVQMLGCGTELFAPQVKSNLDCTLCLDCARACPHDNVMLAVRSPLTELRRADAWPRRWDVALLVWLFTFAGLSNAFGMTPPVYVLEAWLARVLGIANEGVVLLLIFGVLLGVVPLVVSTAVGGITRALAQTDEPLRVTVSTFTPALVPLAFGIWFAHYWFHFATGALSLIPVFQNFLIDHGITLLGATPNWRLAALMPFDWLLPIQLVATLGGFVGSYLVLDSIGRREGHGLKVIVPWLVLLAVITAVAIFLFTQPMEMRGTGFMN